MMNKDTGKYMGNPINYIKWQCLEGLWNIKEIIYDKTS